MGSLGKWDGHLHLPHFTKRFNSKARATPNHASGNVVSGSIFASFPVSQAMIAGSLVLTGDVVAQLRGRWIEKKKNNSKVWHYDWVRSLRMTSYGFLLYGPGSLAWYKLLDRWLPARSLRNLSIKVLLNQVVLGPCVIIVVFAWNSLWQGRLKELPAEYQTKAIPALVDGWKFWIPVTVLNFSVVPLEARVAFMSCGAIFWNFYLSTVMVK